jgi:hypothetical protein
MDGRPYRYCGSPSNDLTCSTTILGLVNRLQVVRREDVRPDGMIQWDKFSRFAGILAVIPECQAKGPMVQGEASTMFKAMILETTIIENEDVSRVCAR